MDTQINSLLLLYNDIVKTVSFQNSNGKEGLENVANYILRLSTNIRIIDLSEINKPSRLLKLFMQVYVIIWLSILG